LLIQVATITNRTTSGVDEYHNPEEVDSGATDVPCLLQQLRAEEIIAGEDRRITDQRLFLLPDVEIDSQSKVTVDDIDYEVVGEPAVLKTPRGPNHLECIVRRIEG
jgi:hypothetical protein